MQKTIEFDVLQVPTLPITLEPNKLYVSKKHRTLGHLCPCGCGTPIYIPFSTEGQTKTDWLYKESNDGKVTLWPSLLSTTCPRKAHYFIEDNRIKWC